MAKYLLVYNGGSDGSAEMSQEEGAKVMQACTDWFASLGTGVADAGNPISRHWTITSEGTIEGGAADPATGIGAYIEAKMRISRDHPFGSKVWASEVMHGAPVIQDYLETTLREWTEGRMKAIQRWIENPLAQLILSGHFVPGTQVTATVKYDEIVFA